MGNQKKCIIWGTDLQSMPLFSSSSIGYYQYDSPRAGGKYLFHTNKTFSLSGIISVEKLLQLSGWIAKENLKGSSPIINIDYSWLEKLPPIPNYNKRTELLLKGLTSLSSHFGKTISLNLNVNQCKDNDTPFLYALSYCSKSEEFNFLLKSLIQSKDIEISISNCVGGIAGVPREDYTKFNEVKDRIKAGDFTDIDIKDINIVITPKGWKRVNKVENRTVKENSKTVFIAMWIDSSTKNPKQSIEKAVRNAGYEPLRIDDKKHINKIDDEILSEIEKARFIVCDLTSAATDKPRSSVYFEAGYAKGKKIPVIWTCKEQMKEVHFNSFDTRQYKCLFWDENNMDDFIKELQTHIEDDKYIGKGPLKGV